MHYSSRLFEIRVNKNCRIHSILFSSTSVLLHLPKHGGNMKKNLLKSTLAIIAGFIFVVIASILTDMVLIKTGLMKQPFYLNTTSFILFVIFYRCLYGTTGSYLTAKLSPNKPMKHVLIGGVIGFIISILG